MDSSGLEVFAFRSAEFRGKGVDIKAPMWICSGQNGIDWYIRIGVHGAQGTRY